MFYEQIKKLCKEKNISMSKLISNFNMSKGNITNWKNGSNPSLEVLQKMAEFFEVSTDYLLGKEDLIKANIELEEIENKVINEMKKLTFEQKQDLLKYAKYLGQK